MDIVKNIAAVEGVNLAYYSAGERGPAVVFLHGGGTDSALLSWRLALPDLAKDFRVFALDWPGYGESESIAGPYTLDKLVKVLYGLFGFLDLNSASLVGLSMGGGAALGFTLTYPNCVDKLILVDSYGIQKKAPGHRLSYFFIKVPFLVNQTWKAIRKDKGMTRAALRSIFANPDNISEDMVDELFEAVQSPSGQEAFYSFQKYEMTWQGLRTNYVDKINTIQVPTLFIHGDKDRLVPLEEVQRSAAMMKNARVKVMKDTGHWAPREHPDVFNQWVREFLREG